ncbi:hypothetical protein KCG48_11965 [Proteiniclasticum sp. BAD-10]|uniref:Uncharacterized protein n=1 Tax=Proteiniclasticum sediminis TaxID=2804028 RepID=A0A941HRJ0_9CLOT|nr:hypothetical protein [Proteiniclasticum sediminis]MBR0577030.1 hypothetical protein [Proteiniclasticum sediminis]
MYNFNEQGKFESFDAAKEHSQNFEGGISIQGSHRKKENVWGIAVIVALLAGLLRLIFVLKD